MPRKKRSDLKLISELKIKEKRRPPVVPYKVKELFFALCPVCGRAIPEKRAIKVEGKTVDWVNYFDSIEWKDDKEFGVVFKAHGRGSFTDWEHINPEDNPELFNALKQRMIEAIKSWISRGYIGPNLT